MIDEAFRIGPVAAPSGHHPVPSRIIIHERIAEWVGLLRPRFAADPSIRWVESRSASDLVGAVRTADRSIVLVNLSQRTLWGMAGLEALEAIPHHAFILVLDPQGTPEVPILARELGATLVWSGVVVPPRVEALIRHWLSVGAAEEPVRNRAVGKRCSSG